MTISSLFIRRPRLAFVISTVITIAGLIAMTALPVAQFPDIVPPQVRVTATYPGASAQAVEESVAQVIEAQVNGVERMIYMKSTSGGDGSYTLTVSFEVGSNPDINTVNVNNRVNQVLSKLPQAKFHLAGKGLNPQDPRFFQTGVVNHGEVPNAEDFMHQHGIMIVPIQAGSGIRIKSLEAMALGVPIVSTSVGAQGLSVTSGAEMYIADQPQAFAEAFARARHFLSFMPEYAGQAARRIETGDPADRREEALLSLVPRGEKDVYSMRRALEMVCDKGTVFEIGRNWGRACITALARLDGWPVMVLASDPSFLGGSWDAKTSEKVERWVKLADLFRLPIVHLVDNPGFMIGREAEVAGTIRYGVQAMNAVYKATVPLASVVMRRAYGIAGSAMSNADLYQYRYCWPSGDWGSLPIAGGLEVAYKSEIEAAEDPAAELDAIRARLAKVTSPFRSAERFNVEDIIDPRDTRPLLCEFAELAWRKLSAG